MGRMLWTWLNSPARADAVGGIATLMGLFVLALGGPIGVIVFITMMGLLALRAKRDPLLGAWTRSNGILALVTLGGALLVLYRAAQGQIGF